MAADLVEVAPAYDTNAELTTMAAADILFDVLTIMVKRGPLTVSAVEKCEKEHGEMMEEGHGEGKKYVLNV